MNTSLYFRKHVHHLLLINILSNLLSFPLKYHPWDKMEFLSLLTCKRTGSFFSISHCGVYASFIEHIRIKSPARVFIFWFRYCAYVIWIVLNVCAREPSLVGTQTKWTWFVIRQYAQIHKEYLSAYFSTTEDFAWKHCYSLKTGG